MTQTHSFSTPHTQHSYLNGHSQHARRPSGNAYARHSDAALALAFDKNFDAFRPSGSSNATQGKIREVAERPLTGYPQRDNLTMLAREVLKRDNVMSELDSVDHGGHRDGIIGRYNPKNAANKLSDCPPPDPCYSKPCRPQPGRPKPCGSSPFNIYSSMSDSSVALAFGNNYKEFGNPQRNGVADLGQIFKIAGREMSGNWAQDNMTLLAREIVKRPHVSHALDSIDDNGRQDGIIGYRNAQLASAHLARR